MIHKSNSGFFVSFVSLEIVEILSPLLLCQAMEMEFQLPWVVGFVVYCTNPMWSCPQKQSDETLCAIMYK